MLSHLKQIFLVITLGVLLAACQTTGLKPGAVTTNFSPKGWAVAKDGDTVVHYCKPKHCKSQQLIAVAPMKIDGDVEYAIRKNILSRKILRALDNLVNVVAKGKVSLDTTRRFVTKSYSGFEHTARVRTDKGYYYWIGRSIVQNDRGTMIFSIASSNSTARRNLNSYMARTSIQRVK